jgi:hypothetical protein
MAAAVGGSPARPRVALGLLVAAVVLSAAAAIPAPTLSITVQSPERGSQVRVRAVMPIRWTHNLPASHPLVDIGLLRCPQSSDSARYCTLRQSFPRLNNNGSFNWLVPTSLSADDAYRIQVWSVSAGVAGTSGIFTVEPFAVDVDTRCGAAAIVSVVSLVVGAVPHVTTVCLSVRLHVVVTHDFPWMNGCVSFRCCMCTQRTHRRVEL